MPEEFDAVTRALQFCWMAKQNPFEYFKTSPEIIRIAVMLHVLFPLSWMNVEDLLQEREIDISYETIRFWWNRFGPMFAANIRRKRIQSLRAWSSHKWHLDKMYVKINYEGGRGRCSVFG